MIVLKYRTDRRRTWEHADTITYEDQDGVMTACQAAFARIGHFGVPKRVDYQIFQNNKMVGEGTFYRKGVPDYV